MPGGSVVRGERANRGWPDPENVKGMVESEERVSNEGGWQCFK